MQVQKELVQYSQIVEKEKKTHSSSNPPCIRPARTDAAVNLPPPLWIMFDFNFLHFRTDGKGVRSSVNSFIKRRTKAAAFFRQACVRQRRSFEDKCKCKCKCKCKVVNIRYIVKMLSIIPVGIEVSPRSSQSSVIALSIVHPVLCASCVPSTVQW